MPEFAQPFSGNSKETSLSREELVRSIRFLIAGEYEAIQMYNQTAEAADSKLAKEVLSDIAKEETVHAGELLRLLYHLSPEEEKLYNEGKEEVDELIEKINAKGY